jgi:hypothetical protein
LIKIVVGEFALLSLIFPLNCLQLPSCDPAAKRLAAPLFTGSSRLGFEEGDRHNGRFASRDGWRV